MPSPTPSTIAILYEDPIGTLNDITDVVLFPTAHFECQMNAVPGTFEFQVKDIDRNLSFVTGREVYVELDGVRLFGGIILQASRIYAFPVVDTADISQVTARQWRIAGVDFNIWFDKRVIRNPADYLQAILINGTHYDGDIIRNELPNYIDVPPGVDMDTKVQNIELLGEHDYGNGNTKVTGIAIEQQGATWRQQMDVLAARSFAVYYIDALKRLHFESLDDTVAPFVFVDHRPNGVTSIGVRDVTAQQDGASIITDALVWGGMEQMASPNEGGQGGLFFARYPTSPARDAEEQDALDAQAAYGRWQYAEPNFQEANDQTSVNHRARAIIMGPPGALGQIQSGMRFPLWNIGITWFAHDVPSPKLHIKPGAICTVILYVMGEDRHHPLIQTLPMRTFALTFPQIPAGDGDPVTFAQFSGSLGLTYSDPRYLWKFLIGNKNPSPQLTAGAASAASTSVGFGAFGAYAPTETPNGTNTTFTLPFPYVAGSARVYLNGLLQRPTIEYSESSPVLGQVHFFTAPATGDTIWVEARTAEA